MWACREDIEVLRKQIMRRIAICLVLLCAFTGALMAQAQPAPAQPQAPPAAPKTHLKVGDPAPDFTLRDTAGKQVKLSDFKGKKNVVLAFYVLAFTGG
jgi:cytochrome oxidase Cu insertion factor (SCO1/SenC/PrrC family)